MALSLGTGLWLWGGSLHGAGLGEGVTCTDQILEEQPG